MIFDTPGDELGSAAALSIDGVMAIAAPLNYDVDRLHGM